MIKHTGLFLLAFFSVLLGVAQTRLVNGMRISRSLKVQQGVYALDAKGSEGVVLLVQGNDIVIDFKNAELKGSNLVKNPDGFFGTGLLIKDSRRVTIKNLKIKGYKIGLLAVNVQQLVLENCDFSYNYRQHLNSTAEKEDISDWMSYHQNEKDEWKRYGAAIYLKDCDSAIVKNCKVTGGQNALMMTGCNNGLIYNNDFSYNSGIGIGLYRSSRNRILYNKLNFNVRGYSHGVYSRGQDSAGILVYEQSNENTFYSNSATHSGDGFFLWAGQSTMDTGQGGCNDNIIMANDFSYAPTNGIEVTFSRNYIGYNRIYECDHGIWGGYSYSTRISDNKFRNNRVAIAIEHGRDNVIDFNLFLKDREAIRLWSRGEQPADWGFAKYRDTRSANYSIYRNSFNGNPVAMNISRTDSIRLSGNIYADVEQQERFDSLVTNVDSSYFEMELIDRALPAIKDSAIDPFKGGGLRAGRKNIMVTEWGPYDFRSPIIWHMNPAATGDTLEFQLLGPKGKWVVKSVKGLKNLSAIRGVFPATIQAIRLPGNGTDIDLQLEYTGEAITTPFGKTVAAGRPYRFWFRKFFQPLAWEVRWYSMDTAFYNPVREKNLFSPTVRMAPVKTDTADRLDYAWWGGLKVGEERYGQFITIAEGKGRIAAGNYELSVTWDDAVRVYVDDKLVLDEWTPSKYKFDESPHRKVRLKLGGNHQFRVEHLELGGFATLALKLQPVR